MRSYDDIFHDEPFFGADVAKFTVKYAFGAAAIEVCFHSACSGHRWKLSRPLSRISTMTVADPRRCESGVCTCSGRACVTCKLDKSALVAWAARFESVSELPLSTDNGVQWKSCEDLLFFKVVGESPEFSWGTSKTACFQCFVRVARVLAGHPRRRSSKA